MRIEYICDKCNSRYSTEAEAVSCEGSHKTPESYSMEYKPMSQFPNIIRFKFGDMIVAYEVKL